MEYGAQNAQAIVALALQDDTEMMARAIAELERPHEVLHFMARWLSETLQKLIGPQLVDEKGKPLTKAELIAALQENARKLSAS